MKLSISKFREIIVTWVQNLDTLAASTLAIAIATIFYAVSGYDLLEMDKNITEMDNMPTISFSKVNLGKMVEVFGVCQFDMNITLKNYENHIIKLNEFELKMESAEGLMYFTDETNQHVLEVLPDRESFFMPTQEKIYSKTIFIEKCPIDFDNFIKNKATMVHSYIKEQSFYKNSKPIKFIYSFKIEDSKSINVKVEKIQPE